MINNYRKILCTLMLLILILGGVLYALSILFQKHNEGSIVDGLPKLSVTLEQVAKTEKKQPAQSGQKVEEEHFLMGNAAQREKVHKWYIEQGYYDFDDQNQSYRSYDQATLQTLAAKGDLRAIDALANLYMTEEFVRENGLAPSTQQFRNAAIWGSTFAFVRLATRYESEVYMFAKTPEEKRYAALEILALYSAGELRGEKWMNRDGASTFKKLQGFTLSETEQKFVAERANQIITDLQQERRKLGLDDFDNSVPPEVEKFFSTLEEIDKKDASMQIK